MDTPSDRSYSSEHEWILTDGDSEEVTIGISDFAQDQLGDIVYVELPDVGATITSGKPFGIVESVKSVSDLFAPVNGEVIARNGDLEETPELVNTSPYSDGWMLKVRLSDTNELDALLDADAYTAETQASETKAGG
jgi:glycine cleavage system H protein